MSENITKTDIFLRNTEVCFLSTIAGDQPKCRPIAFHMMRNGKIYFMISNRKDVYFQMKRFPKVEIVALSGKTWMRYFGTARFEENRTMITSILRAAPQLREDYGENAEDILEVFHLENATVEMRLMSHLTDRYELNITDRAESVQNIMIRMNMLRPDLLKERFLKGHFPAHFQKLVSFEDGRPIGVEALARLIDDEGRIHQPNEFIPMLEDARLIHLLDYHIFEQICKAQRERLDIGLNILPLASNFSGLTMIREDFVPTLIRICAAYQLPPKIIVVEVAESPSEDAYEILRRNASRLKKAGFRVAVDDFGVNTTNVRLLTEVDFDVLKIDKSLIATVHTSKKTKFLLAGLINVCHQLGIRVVALDVENAEQAEVLKDIRCDTGQGRYFAPASPSLPDL